MASFEKSNQVLDEVRVKNEPICYSQSISQTRKSNKVKEEPIDQEVIAEEEEEKYSAREEFTNKASIAFLNEETNPASSQDTPTTSNSQPHKTQKKKTNKLDNSK